MSDDTPICDVCGEPSTPGGDPADSEVGTICPACDDLRSQQVAYTPPEPPTRRRPPHGNTAR